MCKFGYVQNCLLSLSNKIVVTSITHSIHTRQSIPIAYASASHMDRIKVCILYMQSIFIFARALIDTKYSLQRSSYRPLE
jgi:hypothetical protein